MRGVLSKNDLDGYETLYDAKNGKCSKNQTVGTDTDAGESIVTLIYNLTRYNINKL